MANTVIQLKYSNVTGIPPSLNIAEPAYSNVTNKLFIHDGTGVVAIGGKFYTDAIDNGTSANVANTIVERDLSGNFAANIITVAGLTSTGPVTENGYDLFIFANNAYNQANLALTAGGTIAGGYTNAAYGQANAAFGFANTSNTYFYGVNAQQNTNITSASSYANSAFATANAEVKGATAGVYANAAYGQANTATTNATAASSYANSAYGLANTKYSSSGGAITGDVNITGNLTVSGGTTYANTTTVNLGDNIITLNADLPQSSQPTENAGIEIDRGIQPNSQFLWVESSLKWSANNGNTSFFIGAESDGIYANAAYAAANTAATSAGAGSLYANAAYQTANSGSVYANAAFALANTVNINDTASRFYANGAFAQANVATINAAAASSFANSAYALANTVNINDTASRFYANGAFGAANSASSYANSAFAKANTDFTTITGVAGVYGSASVIPVIAYEANGRISLVTNNTIAIAASQITSGTLGVARGGTGNTAFNANYVLLGNGTNAITQTGSSTEGHVLTINSSGVPTFSYLSGGTF